MKKLFCKSLLWIMPVALLAIISLPLEAQTNVVWTKKQAARWYKKREWLNGLNLKPHKSINRLEFARQYHNHREMWEKAFAYLKSTDLQSLKPGKYPIDGENIFVTVAEGKSKTFAVSEWEAHQKYLDIHVVIKGREKIGVAPVSNLSSRGPYSAERDVTFYDGNGKYYLAEPRIFFIFFSTDAHRPNIRAKGFDGDKKIVIKMRFINGE